MEIPVKMQESYNNLSVVNIDFLDFVERNPACLCRSNFKLLELRSNLFKLQPWPTFINLKTKEKFKHASEELFKLIKEIPKKIFNFDIQKMSDYYGIPVKEIKKQIDGATPDHINNLIGRSDFILSPSGLKCLEFNVAVSLGGLQIPIWETLYLNNPNINGFIEDSCLKTKNENLLFLLMKHIFQSTLYKIPGCDTELNVAIISEGNLEYNKDNRWTYLDLVIKDILLQTGSDIKSNILFCNYEHLSFKDDCIFYRGKRIHALVEMLLGYVTPEVMIAFRAGNIRLLNGPISFLLSNKLNLALLSDPETARVFNSKEKDIINSYIPWTRKIRPGCTTYRNEKVVDLEHFILSNREYLVIKPSQGFGGKGICIGRKSTEDEWKQIVVNSLKENNWLVQEMVDSISGFYQSGEKGYELHDMVWGFFLFGTQYSGVWNRVMPKKESKGVVNCHLGASVSMVFTVEENVAKTPAQTVTEKDNNVQMTNEMNEITKKLSLVNNDFIEFASKNPEALKRTSYEALELNHRYYGLQPWPTFISRLRKEEFYSVAIKISSLINGLPARLFNNDQEKISAYFEIPVNLVKIQLEGVTSQHLNNLIGRLDFIFSSTGLKCLEFNASVNAAGWHLPEWEAFYLKTPIILKFLKEYQVQIYNENFIELFFDHIIETSPQVVSNSDEGSGSELNIVILVRDFKDMVGNSSSFQEYLEHLYQEKLTNRLLKGKVFISSYQSLEFNYNFVYFKGNRIHALIELNNGLVPPGVMRAFTQGNLRLFNGPITGLLSNKFCLALLSENEDSNVFSTDEQETIKKYIPWTRKIIPGETIFEGERINMENFLIKYRDQLVIKPAIGLGGEGVYIGKGTSSAQWEILIKTALKKRNYLVQEMVDSPPGLYQTGECGCAPHDSVWGIWVIGARGGGALVRTRQKTGVRKVVNAYTGALLSVVFEVGK